MHEVTLETIHEELVLATTDSERERVYEFMEMAERVNLPRYQYFAARVASLDRIFHEKRTAAASAFVASAAARALPDELVAFIVGMLD